VPEANEPLVFSTGFAVLEAKAGVDARYLYYLCRSGAVVDEVVARSTGVSYPAIDASDLGDLPVGVPSLDEQRRIADFLEGQVARLDGVIELRQRAIGLTRTKRWSTWVNQVERTAAPRVPLRRVLIDLADGPFGSAFTSADYSDAGARVIRLGNIGFAEYRGDDEALIPLDIWATFPRCHVRKGDLLIAGLGDERNHAGRACVAPDLAPALVKGKCFRARVDGSKADPDFVALTLSSPLGADLLAVETRGSTRGMINLEIVKSVAIPLPPVDVQRHMVRDYTDVREQIERAIELERQSLALLEERKQALITAAVTGQFDVTAARAVA
jgi:type I restriction enzyme S subunit